MRDKQKVWQFSMVFTLCLGLFFIGKAFVVYRKQMSAFMYKQLQSSILNFQTPALGYVGMLQGGESRSMADAGKQMTRQAFPIYQFVLGYPDTAMSREDRELMREIILSEGRDEAKGEAVMAYEESGKETQPKSTQQTPKELSGDAAEEGAGQKEGEETTFVYHKEKVSKVDLSPLEDFETLMAQYYSLDTTTTIDQSQLNVEKLLSYDMTLKTPADQPQILIYHTHSQEAFVDSDPSDPATTIVGAGEKLAELLRGYGFAVIHHMGQYDVKSRDYAYSLAAPALEQILLENPSIEVIIDLHRDGVAEGTHIVTEIDGKKMAQFMFFNGLSRTKARGNIEYLANEHIDENLAFSFQAQLVANEYYPGLARKIYLKGYRYNMHYRGKSLLIELGAQTNTVEEIMNAVDPLAHILKITLSGEE